MTSVDDELLISIRPSFADAIFNGSKTVEIRRRIPSIKLGVRLWIYVTKPVGEVRGVARVADIIKGEPDVIWHACGSRTGLSRSDFDDYLDGSATAYGIVLRDVEVGRPVSIAALKMLRPNFHPPQVATRLTGAEAEGLRRHFLPA